MIINIEITKCEDWSRVDIVWSMLGTTYGRFFFGDVAKHLIVIVNSVFSLVTPERTK